MTHFCSQWDQEENRADSFDSVNVLDNNRAMEGKGSKNVYSFIVLFHVLEHLGNFKAIENNPGKRLGPRIYS